MKVPVYEYLARRFYDEGVRDVFALTGDGNMYWHAALETLDGVRSISVRHEHCALAMATSYSQKSGRLGVASVTCGPGLTQTMTAMATAVASRTPLLVFAGEAPLRGTWYNQGIDQGPLVTATGAHYVQAHTLETLPRRVTEAFHLCRTERMPVVLAVPMDLQQDVIDTDLIHDELGFAALPDAGPRMPHPQYVAAAADRLASASRVIVVAGRGAAAPEAAAACTELAELCDGALASTLPVRGLFVDSPRNIGLAGGYAHPVTREAFDSSDLVVAVGASLTSFTTDQGALFDPGRVIQIDREPTGLRHGQPVASTYLAADAALGVRALVDELKARGHRGKGDWDVAAIGARVLTEPFDPTEYPDDGLLDPRAVVKVFDEVSPADWQAVNAAGHCGYFATQMFRRSADRFLTIREFGAVGNGICYAAGVAVARPGEPVILFEGDGGAMMHVQELETLQRYKLKVLVCVLNDGGFGSELHKLRALGLAEEGAWYGRNDLARLAEGFGFPGRTIRSLDEIPAALAEFEAGDGPMLLDLLVSDAVMSPGMNQRVRTFATPQPS